MFEHLGLGVELTLEDNVSRRVQPIIQELDRLRTASQQSANQINSANRMMFDGVGGNAYRAQQRYRDFNTAMQTTDRALLKVTEGLIRSTFAAEQFANATNRAQASGNFNQMYNGVMRAQRVLGDMGFGMTKMQKTMSDQRAYNIMKYQIKDLEDRANLTRKALKEMQDSPDSSKFQKEIKLAQDALREYENQLKKVNMEQKMAETHGLQTGKYRGSTVLYREADTRGQRLQNMLLGASMRDMALAADYAYKSVDKTAKQMVGLGYTTMEAKQKITQMAGALTMLGMTLSTTATLVVGLGTVALVGFAKAFEDAQGQFQARTLSLDTRMNVGVNAPKTGAINDEMQRVWKTTGADWKDISTAMSDIELMMGKMPTEKLGRMAEAGLTLNKVWGVDTLGSITAANSLVGKYGVSGAQSLDIMSIALKKSNGDLDKANAYIEKNIGSLKTMTASGTEGAGAYERLAGAMNNTPTARLMEGFRSLAVVIKELWDAGLGEVFGRIGDGLNKLGNGLTSVLQNNPGLAKFLGYSLGIAGAFVAIAGPAMMLTGVMMQYKGVIEGVTASVFGLSKGGFAVLSPQAKMAKDRVDQFTIAMARLPNTLLATVPLFYNFVRGIPYFVANLAKANPMVAGLTGAFIAYQLNLFGIADTVDKVTTKIRDSWDLAKQITGGQIKFDKIEDYDRLTQVFSKIRGTGIIIGNVIRDWGKGSVMFSEGEVDLLKKLGMDGFATGIVRVSGYLERFFRGFKDGFTGAMNVAKEFGAKVWDVWEARLTKLADLMLGFTNHLNKLFGGNGDFKSLDEAMDKMLGVKDGIYDVGVALGSLTFGFLALKGLGAIISAFTSPFKTLGTSISNVSKKLAGLKALFGGRWGNIPRVGDGGGTSGTTGAGGNGVGGGSGGNTVVNNTTSNMMDDDGRMVSPVVPIGGRDYSSIGMDNRTSDGRTITQSIQTVTPTPSVAHPMAVPVAGRTVGEVFGNDATIRQGANSILGQGNDRNNPTGINGNAVQHGPAFGTAIPVSSVGGNNESRTDRQRRLDASSRERAESRMTRRQARRGLGERIGSGEELDNLRSGRTIERERINQSRIGTDGRYRTGGQEREVFRRNQGTLSRALFGQRYDTYDNNGRRRTLMTRGGIFNRRSNDDQIQDRASLGRRVAVTTRRAVRQQQSAIGQRFVQPAMNRIAQPFRRVGNAVGTATAPARNAVRTGARTTAGAVGRVASPVLKPITQTVRFVAGRLNTAGVVSQARAGGQRAGQQGGGAFSRAFRTAGRIATFGAFFSGSQTAATREGRTSGGRFSRAFRTAGRIATFGTFFNGASNSANTAGRTSGGRFSRAFRTAGRIATFGTFFNGASASANTAGRTSGGRFSRAFRAAGRIATFGTMFNGATTAAGTAGTRAGRRLGQNTTRSARSSSRFETMFSAFEGVAGRVGGRGGRTLARGVTNTARGGMKATSLFANVVKGIGSVAGTIGKGLTGGLGKLLLKGIPMIFKLGFRAIPILGEVLLLWDVVKMVFTNWDAIKGAAKKAWHWITNDGKDMAVKIMSSIKEKLGQAWTWMKTDGVKKMGEFVSSGGKKVMELGKKGAELGVKIGKGLYDKAMGFISNFAKDAGAKIASVAKDAASAMNPLNWGGGGKGKGSKKARGGIVSAPVFGVIGEAGPEAIIPLSSSMSSYSDTLFKQTAGVLGYSVEKKGQGQDKRITNNVTTMSESNVDNVFNEIGTGFTAYANGGIIDRPHMGLVGEAGAEAIIPLSPERKGRAMHLYEKVGKHLGVKPYANGGIVGGKPNVATSSNTSVSKSASTVNNVVNHGAVTNNSSVTNASIKVGSVAGGNTAVNEGRKIGEKFAKTLGSSIEKTELPMQEWQQQQIISPLNKTVKSAQLYGKRTVDSYQKGQDSTSPDTRKYLNVNVGKPYEGVQSKSPSWGTGTVRGFAGGQNSSSTGTKGYLLGQVNKPYDAVEGKSPSWGRDTVSGFAKGQNSSQTTTKAYLDRQVVTHYDTNVKKSPQWGSGTVKGFTSGQNSSQTGTKSYLDKQVVQPFEANKKAAPQWGSGMISSFVQGMKSQQNNVAEASKVLAKAVEKAFKDGLDIRSPSRVMMALGEFASLGVVKGLTNVDIKKYADNQVQDLMGAYAGAEFKGSGAAMASKAISTALMMLGKSQAFLPGLMKVAQHESGFNPNAINNWDINARRGDPSVGLFQIIGSTFRQNMYPGHGNRRNPLDSALAAIRYLDRRYGGIQNHPGLRSMARGGGYKPYAQGGVITHPHFGLVGEDGDEVIVPLTSGKRSRALDLLNQVSNRLGVQIVPREHVKPVAGSTDFKHGTAKEKLTNAFNFLRSNFTVKRTEDNEEENIVRQTSKPVIDQSNVKHRIAHGQNNGGSSDNSITIEKLVLQFTKEESGITEEDARKQAQKIMKEMQKLMREGKFRSSKKNFSIEDLIMSQ